MVMARSWSTGLNVREIDMQDGAHAEIPLSRHTLKDRAGDVEFLHQLPHKGIRLSLTRFDFASRKLPLAFDKDRPTALRDEYAISV
jgi:hypothetical protein